MEKHLQEVSAETSLLVQWLGLCASTEWGEGSIPGGGTNILQAVHHSKKKKKLTFRQINRQRVFINLRDNYKRTLFGQDP